ncbi:hypothetical protein PVAP13_7KG364000 [Panicum virgatum]|uniref:WAT1-related protein n=1 Tax=Panicum virgatum TaxID=38727 RepID=A0A8T0QS79_PANVG|nr:hypothetical protein PVAP13_7KG364000 [Panicum virgatum]
MAAGDLVVSLKPVVGMVSFQVVFAGLNILYKLAVSDGMDLRVLIGRPGCRLFRYERLAIRTLSGQAKVAGTFLGVAGTMLLTFYKGVDITPWHSRMNLLLLVAAPAATHQHQHQTSNNDYAMGSLLCIGSFFFYALWLFIQTKLSKEYPFPYSSTALQSSDFALCFDRDVAQWRLRWDVRLLSIVYAGVLASGVMLVVLFWCVERRGPMFASVFNPLMLLLVAVLGEGKGREANQQVADDAKVVGDLRLPTTTHHVLHRQPH